MFARRLATIALLVGCACGAVMGQSDEAHAGLLRELDQLGLQLDSAQARRDPVAWRRRAFELTGRMARLPLVGGSDLTLPDAYSGADLLKSARQWAGPQAEALPSAARYGSWLAELKLVLRSARRLGAQPPQRKSMAAASERLSVILSRRPYTDVAQTKPGLLETVAHLLVRYLLRPLFGEQAEAARNVVLILSFVLLALVIGHTVWELWHMCHYGREAEGREGVQVPGLRALRLFSGEELLREGDRVRAGGQFLRALGFYDLALLSWLAAAGCTDLDHSLTNWEHYRRAADSTRMRAEGLRHLAELSAFFDEHCYGGRALSEALVAAFRAKVLWLREAVHAVTP